MTRLVAPDLLESKVVETLIGAGLSSDKSRVVARVLVDADVRGHHSHGVELLPTYLTRIAAGGIDVAAQLHWSGVGVVSIVDAAGGPGQIAMMAAVEHGIDQAREYGAAVVGVRNNNHVGMLAAYRQPVADAGMTALVLNISGPSVAPPGGRRATLGNGACCLISAVPGRDPFIADFATGVVALGKIRRLGALGRPVPEGWLLDRNGEPSTDAADLDSGGCVPVFGGHKGLCVALIVEVLAGILAGDTVSPLVNKQRQQPERAMGCSQFVLVMDHAAFGVTDLAGLHDQLEDSVRHGYDSPPWLHYPEQFERRNTERAGEGVQVSDAVLEVLSW